MAKLYLFSRIAIGGLLLLLLNSSCSSSYARFSEQYVIEYAKPAPDYNNLYYWASHPRKKDPADSISKALANEERDTVADVFFVHPTTYTKDTSDGLNAAINNATLNAKTDYSAILYQASVFNQHARIFAPRYRQAHLSCFYLKDSSRTKEAFEIAYADVREAFLYYLQNENKGRPFIIASHSQGTLHAARLIKELIQETPLQKQMVVAYLIGLPVPERYFSGISACTSPEETGCFVSWRTFKSGYLPDYVKKENFKAVVVNPLTWATGTELAGREKNEGAILYKYHSVFRHTNDARVQGNVLWVHKPHFPWSFLYLMRNYHIGDINLFYLNIRRNVETRLKEAGKQR